MGMNNWGGITEHMLKKPRTVFSNHKKYDTKNKKPRKRDYQIDEEKILKAKSKKLRRDLLIWYVIPVSVSSLIICVVILNKLM